EKRLSVGKFKFYLKRLFIEKYCYRVQLLNLYHFMLFQDVIHIEDMKVTFLVGGMRIHLSNLFNGNKVLGASLNMFLNQNANEVISELRPDLEKGLADIFTGLWNNVFSKMPIK